MYLFSFVVVDMSIALWNPTDYYVVGNVVLDGGLTSYACIVDNINLQPSLNPVEWTPVPNVISLDYGEFNSTGTQALFANTPLAILIGAGTGNAAVPGGGIYPANNLTISVTGVYQISWTVICENVAGVPPDIQILTLLRVNGGNLPNTTRQAFVEPGEVVSLSNTVIVSLTSGDTLNFIVFTTSATGQLLATPASPTFLGNSPSFVGNLVRIA